MTKNANEFTIENLAGGLDPYAEHRAMLWRREIEVGCDVSPEDASWITSIRRDHIEQLKREMDRKLVGTVDYYDCWDGEA